MAVYRPALIIRLDIDVDTAFSRKPDHSYEELKDKIAAMVRLQYNGSRIIELDARAPYDEVLSNALNAISAVVNPAKRPQSDLGNPARTPVKKLRFIKRIQGKRMTAEHKMQQNKDNGWFGL